MPLKVEGEKPAQFVGTHSEFTEEKNRNLISSLMMQQELREKKEQSREVRQQFIELIGRKDRSIDSSGDPDI